MLHFFDSSLGPEFNPVQDYANGGISGFPIKVDPATYDPAGGFADDIDYSSPNDPMLYTITGTGSSTGSGGGGFNIAGINGFAIIAFLAGLILIFNWK